MRLPLNSPDSSDPRSEQLNLPSQDTSTGTNQERSLFLSRPCHFCSGCKLPRVTVESLTRSPGQKKCVNTLCWPFYWPQVRILSAGCLKTFLSWSHSSDFIYLSANHKHFINQYVHTYLYVRWPNTTQTTTDDISCPFGSPHQAKLQKCLAPILWKICPFT